MCKIQRFDFECNLVVKRKVIIPSGAALRFKKISIFMPLASCVRRKVLNVTKFRVTKFSIIKYRLQLYELYPDTSVHVVQLY